MPELLPMLVTQQPILRRFWYAAMPLGDLASGPKPFRLLGQNVALFLDAEGQPAAVEDRCPHRTAKLSKGWCRNGNLVCGYHGWEFSRDGKLVNVPQFPFEQPIPDAHVRPFWAQSRYGYVWVALDEPIADIPEIPEATDPIYRRIPQFYQRWNTAALRLMENSFDNAHVAFVHKATFGNIDQPRPSRYEIIETEDGFRAETVMEVRNPGYAARVTGCPEGTITRTLRNRWFLPFCRRLDMEYPSGIRHIIFNCATPVDDGEIQVVQVLFRNDTEADCSAQELIDWDAAIVAEDREILESTDPDATVDMSRKIERHMPSDRPGMIMRKRLLALLAQHGETEQFRAANAQRP